MLKLLNEKYGLSTSHIARLLSKTEKSLVDDLESNTNLSSMLKDILSSPSKLEKLIEDGKSKIPASIYKNAINKINAEKVKKFSEIFEGEVFLKQVKSNELGFRKGIPGKAGSFMLIPKNCVEMFPTLSNSILNSSHNIHLTIKPENESRNLEFVYHNSKIVEGDSNGRDEYRLYNNNFLNNKVLLKPGNIVLIIKTSDSYDYYLYRFNELDADYSKLLNLIKKYKQSRAIAAIVPLSELILNNIKLPELYEFTLYNDNLSKLLEKPIIENKTDTAHSYTAEIDDTKALKDLLNRSLQSEDTDMVLRKIKQIKRDSRFKRIVSKAYNNKCAITKTCIEYNYKNNIQACHIIGKSYGGTDNPQNGIALDRNLHWAFDMGMFTITEDYLVLVHPKMIKNEILSKINGVKIFLPEDINLRPNQEALKYHRENIYGSFEK